MTTPWTDPTHSEAPRPRKPRRIWLIIPWVGAAVLAIGWSLWWLWLMNAATSRMDGAAARMRAAGWRVAWASRQTGGYPFRLDIDVTGLELADPSGWGLAIPATLKTEGYAFAPTHWLFAAPDGRMTITRPGGGPLAVTARTLRGSISGVGEGVPRLALEGSDLAFSAGPGGAPPLLASAKSIQCYTRPGPDDQGALYLQIDGGTAAPDNWLAALSAGGPVALKTDAIFGHASAFAQPTWRQGATAWAHAGGALEVQHVAFSAGAQSFTAASGALTVGDDGRVIGELPLVSGGQAAPLAFHGDGAWIGTARVAPAPRVF